MQQAIPVREHSGDERADRARGAGIAFLAMIAAGGAFLALLVLLVLTR